MPVQANIKLLRYLKTGFQRPIDWNRCCLLMNMQGKNQNQNYLNEPNSGFQSANMLIEDSLKTFKPLQHSSKLIKHVPKSIKHEKMNR